MVTPITDVTVTPMCNKLKCNVHILATRINKVTDGYTCYRWLHLLQQLHPRHLILIILVTLLIHLSTYYYVIGFASKP